VAGPVPAQYVWEDCFETTMRTIARHLQNQGDGYAASIPAAGCIATLEDGDIFSYSAYKDGTVDFENGMTPEIGAWDDLDPIFTAWAKEPVFIESPLNICPRIELVSRSECARGTSCGERAIRRAPRRDAGRASAGLINRPFCNTTYRERHDLSELIGQ
jgi:hypothetical protein